MVSARNADDTRLSVCMVGVFFWEFSSQTGRRTGL